MKTQLLLDRILAVAGLPTDEQPGRVWSRTATIWSDGNGSFTSVDGVTETALIDVDSDPWYGTFVDQVAEQLRRGFVELPRISDLETTMAVIWDAYAPGRQGRTGVHTQHR